MNYVGADTHIAADGVLTFREAVEVINQGNFTGLDGGTIANQISGSLGDNDKIVFSSALNGGQVLLTIPNGQVNITKSLTIDASSLSYGITIKGDDNTPGSHNDGEGIRIFNITDDSGGLTPPTVTMIAFTITHADPFVHISTGPNDPSILPEGGAIRSEGILKLQNMKITENGADFGAGVFMAVAGGGTTPRTILDIENSQVDGNSAFRDGGGVYVRFSSTTNSHDVVLISTSTLSSNVVGPRAASSRGGAIFVQANSSAVNAHHSVVATASHFDNNRGDTGGAIFVNGDFNVATDLTIQNQSTVTGNVARSGDGGGVSVKAFGGSLIQINDSTVSRGTNVNASALSSALNGGGVAAELNQGSSLSIARSTISGNTSGGDGGGIFVYTHDISSFRLTDSTVSGNSANNDGGGVCSRSAKNEKQPFALARTTRISNSLIEANTALNRGGGIFAFNDSGTETLVESSRITGNHVPNSSVSGLMRNGGGIYAYVENETDSRPYIDAANKPRWTITGSTVDNNDTWQNGGGIFVCSKFNGDFIATNSTFSNNQTTHLTLSGEGDMLGSGGGMFIAHFKRADESVDAYLRNLTFTQNVSAVGGGLATLAMFPNVRVRMDNTIVSENYDSPAKVTKNDFTGPLVINDSFNNLVGNNSTILDSTTFPFPTINHNFLVSNNKWIFNNFPLLGPLQMNGGPTPTHALIYDTEDLGLRSPAIDAGSETFAKKPLSGSPELALLIDQRGAHRSYDFPGIGVIGQGPVDIGAYELQAPVILDVTFSSTVANPFGTNPPYSFADEGHVGSAVQLASVPVGGANQISVQFSSAVNIGQNDLQIIAINRVVTEPTITGFVAPSASNNMTGTWTFSGAFPSAVYVLRVPGTIQDDGLGLAVDGEWLNPVSITANVASNKFPSGDGIAGGDFQFLCTFLQGDADRNLFVNFDDFQALLNHYLRMGGWADGDFTGDGSVQFVDFQALFDNYLVNFRNFALLGDYDHNWRIDALDAGSSTTPGTFEYYFANGDSRADLDGNGTFNQADRDAFNSLLNFPVRILVA